MGLGIWLLNYGCPIAHLLFPVYVFNFNLIYMISRIPGYLSCIPRYLSFIPRYLSCIPRYLSFIPRYLSFIFQYVLVLKKFPDIQLQFLDIDVFPVTLTVPSLPSLPSHCDDVTFAISALQFQHFLAPVHQQFAFGGNCNTPECDGMTA